VPEVVAEVVACWIDGLAQEPLQAVPGCKDLPQWPLSCNGAVAIKRHALGHFYAEIPGPSTAFFKGVQEFRMSRYPRAAPDQLDRGSLL
jgi:hypothetical protein